ncbi:molybdenum cofactor guanylyltransferase [Thiosulfatimonas sediminis]|uniref:Molybdenum cofactor guanylyltransferase n=1 Tax=Thiosulfatimonas sediminis TaxID=2675054 RepID=A0A6F8PVP9_9GAMM|nr:NTP transferase domain-containing protein [Thiosulfatimonas sediminis]BBP46189.1 molybdenum cofactor guanylyltransferase [Thiosulfatimonas sediminis]
MLGIIVLSGGEGRRMGGQDKGWCCHQQQPFVALVVAQIEQQLKALGLQAHIVISANRNLSRYQALGYPVICDRRGGQGDYQGPLAGIESALEYGLTNKVDYWVTWPVDSIGAVPQYLQIALGDWRHSLSNNPSTIRVLQTLDKLHFAHLGLATMQISSLKSYLDSGQRSIKGWLQTRECVTFTLTCDAQLLNCNQF